MFCSTNIRKKSITIPVDVIVIVGVVKTVPEEPEETDVPEVPEVPELRFYPPNINCLVVHAIFF